MIRILRKLLAALGWAAFGAVALALSLYVMRARGMPDLEAWHHEALGEDFQEENAGESLAEYLAREDRLFGVLEREVWRRGPTDLAAAFNRFNPRSPLNPANWPRNWNRSFEVEAPEARGDVLFLHGLTDSPYSARALSQVFLDRGFSVLSLRLPGHGTIPGALAEATWRDWREAVRVGARHVAESVGAGRPLYLVGYSNGAALAVNYALDVLEGSSDPKPAGLVLLSPAIGVTPVAAFARFQRRLSHLPGLEKLLWADILPEFDPFKYNSFPIFAAEQIHGLTAQLRRRMARLAAAQGGEGFPPVLVFQSVVDASVPVAAVVDRLLDKLGPPGSELVLFDVNRIAKAEPFIRTGHDAFLGSLLEAPELPYSLTLVTNASPSTTAVVARTRAAGETGWTEVALGLDWPRGVYSLSHVALPFPPDDPIYGIDGANGDDTSLHLGSLELRGERGVLVLPIAQVMRLRYNPFFAYVEERVAAELEGP